MASLAEIAKLLDEKLDTKLAAARKEIVDDQQSTFLHKIEADIADLKEQATTNQVAMADLKEQAAANQIAIARLEKGSSSQIPSKEDPAKVNPSKVDPFQAKQSPYCSTSSSPENTGEWKPKFHNSTRWSFPPLMARKIHCHGSLVSSNFLMGRAHQKAARCGSHPTIWQEERHYGTVVSSVLMAHLHGGSSLCC
jgi:hypothetical protein